MGNHAQPEWTKITGPPGNLRRDQNLNSNYKSRFFFPLLMITDYLSRSPFSPITNPKKLYNKNYLQPD
jgi:hypothetical protein